MMVKRICYWKGPKPSVQQYIEQFSHQQKNGQVVTYANLYFDVPQIPVQFIAMNLNKFNYQQVIVVH